KTRSRMNAWKHGLRAEKVVIAGEEAKDLQAIQRELWEEHQPSPGMETLLVERLAHYAWRMRRALVFEAALLEEGPIRPGRLGFADGNALSTLLRYEMAMANASYRTLQQLLFLQDRRLKKRERPYRSRTPRRGPRAIGNSRRRGGIAEPPDTPASNAPWGARALNCGCHAILGCEDYNNSVDCKLPNEANTTTQPWPKRCPPPEGNFFG